MSAVLCHDISLPNANNEHSVGTDAETHDVTPQGSQFALLDRVILLCCKRFRSWPVPTNWCASDWFEEILQIGWVAALEAVDEFDASRSVPLEAFLYQRVLARARTWVRRECSYASRFEGQDWDDSTSSEKANSAAQGNCVEFEFEDEPSAPVTVLSAMNDLPFDQRALLRKLFWDDLTEREAGALLGIGQRAVNKRKQAALRSLREHPRIDSSVQAH